MIGDDDVTMPPPVRPIQIDDAHDPRITEYLALRERGLRGVQGRDGVFIGEAVLVVSVMLETRGLTRSVLASDAISVRGIF